MLALLNTLLNIFLVLIFVRIVLSWFPPSGGVIDQIREIVGRATEWAMAPLRRVLPPVRLGNAGLDLSPMVLIFGIYILRAFLHNLA